MNGFTHLTFGSRSVRTRSLLFFVTLTVCFTMRYDLALSQSVPSAGGPPPLLPPQVAPLPTGDQSLALGQWLIHGSVGVSTFYNSNIYQTTTPPILQGPGVEIKPSLLADFNTGIYETSVYGNIDSSIYPTLDSSNDTFNRQAGLIQKYSPLPDLQFTAQGNYAHSTNATVLLNSTTPAATSIPSPIISPANPALPGAAGVVANTQTVVDPNDTYTTTASVFKEFNRAYAIFGGSISDTIYETTPATNYSLGAYYGAGGIWFSPLFYAFASGAQSFYSPAVGLGSASYFIKSGIGSDRIGFFQGSIYAGEQATVVADNGGEASGDIYGGAISYFPIQPWSMTLSVDQLRNVANITAATSQALSGSPGALPSGAPGGLSLSGVAISTDTSAQITTLAYRTNYEFSPQTSGFGVFSVIPIAYLGTTRVDYSWNASVGIRHQLKDHLTLTFDYRFTRYESEVSPSINFTANIITLGAIYTF